MQDDLTSLKDDMTAFIEGHGMRRFHGYVNDEVTSVMWDPHGNTDSWKDFVELAKASGAPFLTMNDVSLDREDVDYLVEGQTTPVTKPTASFSDRDAKNDPCAQSCMRMNVRTRMPAVGKASRTARAVDHSSAK